MAANTDSYFVFHLRDQDNAFPKPGPEWPPVEPTPIPPTTDPVPTVPPVNGFHFALHPIMLN